MPLVRKPPSGTAIAAPPTPDAEAVFRMLAHGTDDERWSAARAAAALEASEPALGEALAREKNPRVREALLTSLARIATSASVEIVLPLLRSDDAFVRREGSDALLAMKDAAWPYLAALLQDDDADVRVLACGLARDMPNEEAVHLYCGVLDSDPEANVCAAAVEALAEIAGTDDALPALTRCAERFRATPFLAFSIQIVIDRLRSRG
jgi:HEAT repeat protein